MNFKNPLKFYVGLIHGPVLNRLGEHVTTSVTNMDLHDISRTCRSFGAKKFFIQTPLLAQQELLARILDHWGEEHSQTYHPDRHQALSSIQVLPHLQDILTAIKQLEGRDPFVVVTGANFSHFDGETCQLLEKMDLELDNPPMLLLFGTGWGLTPQIIAQAQFRLAPLFGMAHDGYNHLSVRSAVAIYCDRIRGSLLQRYPSEKASLRSNSLMKGV